MSVCACRVGGGEGGDTLLGSIYADKSLAYVYITCMYVMHSNNYYYLSVRVGRDFTKGS